MIKHEYVQLVSAFFRREWIVRYGNGGMGMLILLGNPLTFIGLKMLSLNNVWSESEFTQFLFGLMWWLLLSSTITNSAAIVSSYSALVGKINFPRSILVILPILLAFTDFILGLILYLGFVLYYKTPTTQSNLLIPLFLLSVLPFLVGISAILVTFIFRFKKFRYAIPMIILIAFISTPFLFVKELNNFNYIQDLNPFHFIINISHKQLSINHLIKPLFIGIIYLILGLSLFNKSAKAFADY